MESMDFWKLIQNEEAILFLFNGLEDDTSLPNKNEETTHNSEDDASPPKKRGKHVPDFNSGKHVPDFNSGKHVPDFNSSEQKLVLDLGLREDKPETRDQWENLFEFNHYTSEPPKEMYQGMFTKCEDELKAVKKAYNKAAIFFKSEFGELEKVQPCSDSFTVIETITSRLGLVKRCILRADEILLLFFASDVETYLKFRDGPLFELKRLEDQYYKKLEELSEMYRVDELVEVLMCEVKSDEREKCSGLTMGDIYGIIHFLWKKFDCSYVQRANMMSVEQFNRSEMKDVVTNNKDLIENIRSSWKAYETALDSVEEEGWKLQSGITDHMYRLVNCLKTAGLMLRVMRKQLELLCTKDVILNGYDDDFFDDWNEISWHYELTSNFYV